MDFLVFSDGGIDLGIILGAVGGALCCCAVIFIVFVVVRRRKSTEADKRGAGKFVF